MLHNLLIPIAAAVTALAFALLVRESASPKWKTRLMVAYLVVASLGFVVGYIAPSFFR